MVPDRSEGELDLTLTCSAYVGCFATACGRVIDSVFVLKYVSLLQGKNMSVRPEMAFIINVGHTMGSHVRNQRGGNLQSFATCEGDNNDTNRLPGTPSLGAQPT
jgi:hypothetical protein